MKSFIKSKVVLWSIALLGVAGVSLTTSIKQDFFEMSKQLEIMTSVFRELNIYYVDPLSPGELVHTGIDSMLDALDPYTIYYPEEKMEDVRFISTGEYGGIGITLKENWEGKHVITDIIEDGPAEDAGLKVGDEIVTVKGQTINGESIDAISKYIKGASGTEVELGVRKLGEENTTTITLEREKIKSPDIPYRGMVSDKTGYLILSKFTKTASAEVKKSLTYLTDSLGAENIILDLRGNGGGLLREAVNIVNFFVPKGTQVVEMRGKTEAWNKNYATLRRPLLPEVPLAILIDERSASASEIVSGAIQELDRGVVIGRESFGKGLVQQTKDLAYGSRMKITVAKYYTPSGRCVQRLHYGDRDESGKATEAADSTLKVFYTTNGRPVLEGRGVFPDVEIEPTYANYVLDGLINNDVFFDFAISRDLTIEDPSKYILTNDDWSDFISFVEEEFDGGERGLPYEPISSELLEMLENTLEEDGLLALNQTTLDSLQASILPNIREDIKRNEEAIRKSLEEEIVFQKANTTGLFEYQLPRDPNTLKAIELLESGEHKDILLGKGE
ncbi:MAG: peptidase S41 [Euryarchaeota archaeon]|nr:peptidase S41 [Euryarchaeota archaeon]